MAHEHQTHEHHGEHHHPHPHEHGHEVEVTIDNKSYKIRTGSHTVSELKALGHVPQAFELEEVREGKLVPLPDDGVVSIKGCEKFVSHPKANAAS